MLIFKAVDSYSLLPLFALILLLTSLGGCAVDPNQHANALAQSARMTRTEVSAPPFVLTAFVRITRHDQPLTVYIEGDGRAWRNRNTPSDDPTPHQALGLSLATTDPSANVVYLARPCQFTPKERNPFCENTFWTNKRFAPEVIRSLDQAIEHFMEKVQGQRLNLVGYSGGGALAVLLAARRNDVLTIRTVAGNLDHVEVNRQHLVSPMPESENAIDVARQISTIPQIHFSGSNDDVVPPSIAQRFVTASGGRCVKSHVVSDMSHEGDWAAQWRKLLTIQPHCLSPSLYVIDHSF